MSIQLFVSEDGKGATARFKDLEKKVGGSTVMMAEVMEVVATENKAHWPWDAPITQKTRELKAKYGESIDPLVETGRMKDELTTVDHGRKRLRPAEMIWGSNSLVEKGGQTIPLAKAYLLQHGSKHQKRIKVLKVTPATRLKIAAVVRQKMFGDD